MPAAWKAMCVWPLVLACAGGERATQEGPLGWSGPVRARESRLFSAGEIAAVPLWEIGEPPAFVVVPDSILNPDGEGNQRYVAGAVVTTDDKAILLTDPQGPDSTLLLVVDAVTGEETRVRSPVGADGEPLVWADAGIAADDRGVVLVGSQHAEFRIRRRDRREGVWFATSDGEFRRPPGHVKTVGGLMGVFPDGSLVVVSPGWTRTTDSTLVSTVALAKPVPVATELSSADSPMPLYETALLRDPGADYPRPSLWGHDPRLATGVAGDTIWTVPTERPELVALDRFGEVLLKVEWEHGDRAIPPNASNRVRERLGGLLRFPAAKRLLVGTNDLVHVQRIAWRDGQPRSGPDWLVFSRTGDLVARAEIPSHLEVMAFGPGSVVTRARDEHGVVEIRVYAVRKRSGSGDHSPRGGGT